MLRNKKKIQKSYSQEHSMINNEGANVDPVVLYMEDMGKAHLLKKKDEIDLAKKIEYSAIGYSKLFIFFPQIISAFIKLCEDIQNKLEYKKNTEQIYPNYSNIIAGLRTDRSDHKSKPTKVSKIVLETVLENKTTHDIVEQLLKCCKTLIKQKQPVKSTLNKTSKLFSKIKFTSNQSKKFFEIVCECNNQMKACETIIRDILLEQNIKIADITKIIDTGTINTNWLNTRKISLNKAAEEQLIKAQNNLNDFLSQHHLSYLQFKQIVRDFFLHYQQEKDSKNTMVNANLRLVVAYAAKKSKKNIGLQFLDYIQFGNLGLIKAVDKFDWRLGYKFSTYATCWLHQAIARAIADQSRIIRIPVHLIETINRISKTSKEIIQSTGKKATNKEISEKIGLSADKISKIMKIAKEPASMDAFVGPDEDASLVNFLEDVSAISPDNTSVQQGLRDVLNKVISTLSEREAKVISMRFGLNSSNEHTLEEVGRQLSVTRERIRQVQEKTIKKLRSCEYLEDLEQFISHDEEDF